MEIYLYTVISKSYLGKINGILTIITIKISSRDKFDPLEITTRCPVMDLCILLE